MLSSSSHRLSKMLWLPIAKLDIKTRSQKLTFSVLGGKVAVSCNPQSAIVGLNSCLRILISFVELISGVESQAQRNCEL